MFNNLDPNQVIAYTSLFVGSVIGLHTVFLLARFKTATVIRATYPIIFTLCVLFGAKTYVDIQGYPVRTVPEGEWEYIHHELRGQDIVLWLQVEDNRDRMYVIPYSDKNKERLEGAAKEKQEGKRVRGEAIEIKSKNIGEDDELALMTEVINLEDLNEKDE